MSTLFKKRYLEDPTPCSVLKALEEDSSWYLLLTLAEYKNRHRYLYYRNRLYVPDLPELKAKLLNSCHKLLIAGHLRSTRTYEILDHKYYWPQILHFI